MLHRARFLALAVAAGAFLTLASPPSAARAQGEQTWPPPETATMKAPGVTLAELKSGGKFGLGFGLGSRSGLSIKLWPVRAHAITVDVGATPFTNTLAFAAGYELHIKPIRSPVGVSAQFRVGVGFRARLLFVTQQPGADDEDATSTVSVATVLGVRVPLGVSFLLEGFPVEVYAEAAPALDFWQGFGVDVEGIGGARVFF